MSFTVEDGTGLPGANAYVSVADCAAYAADRGLTFPDSPSGIAEQAIVRASAAIDAKYGNRFPGERLKLRDQGLEWPRAYAYDRACNLIASDAVPVEIVNATCEAAVRELASPGGLMPDLERGGQIRSLQAGSVRVEYGSNAEARTTFTLIDGMLSGILGGAGAMFPASVRG